MPSTLKRPSLGRLLNSLRPFREGTPSSAFPVQTGFPTSLADLVVRNHGRLRKPRKPRRSRGALVSPPSTVAVTVEVADELTPPPTEPLSPVDVAELPSPSPPIQPLSLAVAVERPKGVAIFRLRPELLALGGAVALALLAVWSEGTVAAFTVAALSLLWVESAFRRRRRRHPADAEALLDSCGRGRGPASPIREVEEAPRSSCSDSDKGSEGPSSPRTFGDGGDDPTTPKLKAKRSLRKLISKKLRKKLSSKDLSDSSCSFDQPDAGAGDSDPAVKTESLVPFSTEQTPSESSIEWSSSSSEPVVVDGRGPGVKFPLAALAPVILAGLAAGKLPATALAVLCVALFSGAVQRV